MYDFFKTSRNVIYSMLLQRMTSIEAVFDVFSSRVAQKCRTMNALKKRRKSSMSKLQFSLPSSV